MTFPIFFGSTTIPCISLELMANMEDDRWMGKRRAESKIYSYGIYSKWESDSSDIPKLVRITTVIPAQVGIEFGYIVKICKARGSKITFRIEHPPFLDDTGEISPPFTGEIYVRSNTFDFFLGDTIWEPVHDKCGPWRLLTYLDGALIADKTLHITAD